MNVGWDRPRTPGVYTAQDIFAGDMGID